METVMKWIALPLGYGMAWCYALVKNYGWAILLFTLLTKVILLPLSVWVQKNSIKMVQMQPALLRSKARHFGDPDAAAEEETRLYKQYRYHPLASLIPLAVQLVLLMGVVEVIYHPLDHLFHLPQAWIGAINGLASQLSGLAPEESSLQLTALELLKDPAYAAQFAALGAGEEGFTQALAQIQQFRLTFFGIDLSYIPSLRGGMTLLIPLAAGFSSFLLCYAQNKANVLQAEQSALNQWGMLILSVGLSLYLGLFVPAGIALYWIASNLLAIGQLYGLNAVIPPKKYVDYAALEESRKELAALQNLGGEKKRPFRRDPLAKRERADYRRFFSIRNMHLVFYSESSGFYKYYQALIDYLLKKTNVVIHYVTNDPQDRIFEKAKAQPRIKPYYIGVKKLIPLMMRLEADVVVMTTPDLDNFYLKRSLMKPDAEYIYVPHDPASIHMGFREHALDHFDTIFCTGPHVAREVRACERAYGTREKTLVEFGYPLMEDLMAACEQLPPPDPNARRRILIAPSWQEDNLLDSCVEALIDGLYGPDYSVIVRPHPEYKKRYGPKLTALVEKYQAQVQAGGMEFELDFSGNTSVYSSDLLVTDWSGIGIEFGFATLKPVIFINTKIKMENPNYEALGLVPQEVRLRNVLGVALEKEGLRETIGPTVKALLEDGSFRERIREERSRYFYSLGTAGAVGGSYLARQLVKKRKQ